MSNAKHQKDVVMKPLVKEIVFETEVGNVVIVGHENGFFYEFTSGYANGLHNYEPYKTFDAVYRAVRATVARQKENQKYEN